MATKKSTKKTTKKTPTLKFGDSYDDYKYGYDSSKEKRRFIDFLYALFLFLFGMGGLVAWYFVINHVPLQ